MRDWVVIYAEDVRHRERRYTVVTATVGSLVGRRIVRGSEDECRGIQLPATRYGPLVTWPAVG